MCDPKKGCVIFIVGLWKEYISKSHTVDEGRNLTVYWSDYTLSTEVKIHKE